MLSVPYEPWSWVPIGLVAYVVLCFVLMYAASYFYGDSAEAKVEHTIALPMWIGWGILVALVKLVAWVVTHPWRARFNHQFYSAFHTYPWERRYVERYRSTQFTVEEELEARAVAFERAADAQEVARANMTGRSKGPVAEADARVGEAKKAFWHAHSLARRGGYEVKKTYHDYLVARDLRSPAASGGSVRGTAAARR